jgi:hypothetical protein
MPDAPSGQARRGRVPLPDRRLLVLLLEPLRAEPPPVVQSPGQHEISAVPQRRLHRRPAGASIRPITGRWLFLPHLQEGVQNEVVPAPAHAEKARAQN